MEDAIRYHAHGAQGLLACLDSGDYRENISTNEKGLAMETSCGVKYVLPNYQKLVSHNKYKFRHTRVGIRRYTLRDNTRIYGAESHAPRAQAPRVVPEQAPRAPQEQASRASHTGLEGAARLRLCFVAQVEHAPQVSLEQSGLLFFEGKMDELEISGRNEISSSGMPCDDHGGGGIGWL